jgi:hypothetical protein
MAMSGAMSRWLAHCSYPESHAGHIHSQHPAAGWLQQLAAKRQGLAAILVGHGPAPCPAEASGLCQVRHFLIGWGREYPEASGSAFVTSYSITTDQGQLHVDDAAVYRDIMQARAACGLADVQCRRRLDCRPGSRQPAQATAQQRDVPFAIARCRPGQYTMNTDAVADQAANHVIRECFYCPATSFI